MLDIRNRAEARRYKEEQRSLGKEVEIEDGDVDWLYGKKTGASENVEATEASVDVIGTNEETTAENMEVTDSNVKRAVSKVG